MSHKLIWESGGVYWKYYEKVSGKEIAEASKAIYADPRFDDLKYKLVDFLDVESVEMNKEEVIRIACQHRAAAQSNRNVKTALVIKPDANKLADKFASLFKGSSWETQVFQDLNEANDWLGRKASI